MSGRSPMSSWKILQIIIYWVFQVRNFVLRFTHVCAHTYACAHTRTHTCAYTYSVLWSYSHLCFISNFLFLWVSFVSFHKESLMSPPRSQRYFPTHFCKRKMNFYSYIFGLYFPWGQLPERHIHNPWFYPLDDHELWRNFLISSSHSLYFHPLTV